LGHVPHRDGPRTTTVAVYDCHPSDPTSIYERSENHPLPSGFRVSRRVADRLGKGQPMARAGRCSRAPTAGCRKARRTTRHGKPPDYWPSGRSSRRRCNAIANTNCYSEARHRVCRIPSFTERDARGTRAGGCRSRSRDRYRTVGSRRSSLTTDHHPG
jgi:hypothetical protein